MPTPFVLCVDDEKSVTDTLISQLESHFGEDFAFEAAEDVDEAWEVIEDLKDEGMPLALVISDWLMPKTKGDEFLLEVHKRWPNAPLIMLSGHADEGAVNEVRAIVPDFTFVKKPWERDELMALVSQKLSKSAPA